MLKSILIGLDGSPYSRVAVEMGIRWAKRYDALLVGLGIIDIPTICRPQPVPIGASDYKVERDILLVADARRKIKEFLKQFASRCAQAKVDYKVLGEVGLPADIIALEAQRYDLMLLGVRTYFHFETQEGSDETLRTVLKHSSRPIVTVPNRVRDGRCILVAYDGSLQAARAIQAFQATGLDDLKKVHVICVSSKRTVAISHAERAREFLRFHDINVSAHPIVSGGSVARIIIEQVKKLNPSLLVMGAYGQPALREFFFGSVTRFMLKQSSVPLFLYH